MKKNLDNVLKQVLTPDEEAGFWLNQKICNSKKETTEMKHTKKRIPVMVLSVILVLGLGTAGVFAAMHYLAPEQVAQKLEDKKLMDAFTGKNAVSVNETQSYDGYNITFLGTISGKNISESLTEVNGQVKPDRTYAVTAIEKADKTPMTDEDNTDFFVSPLMSGCNPAKYNIVTMNGGYRGFVQDGVLYRVIDCDNIEMFAGKPAYLCVTKSTFYDAQAYEFNEEDGSISRNNSFMGMNALFTLPLDASKADAAAVEKYCEQMDKNEAEETDRPENLSPEQEKVNKQVAEFMEALTPDNFMSKMEPIAETKQVVTPDAEGTLKLKGYELEDGSGADATEAYMEYLFQDVQAGVKMNFSGYSYSDTFQSLHVDLFLLNADGTVTFEVYTPAK